MNDIKAASNKKAFEVGKEEWVVVRPNGAVKQKAALVYNRTFKQLVKPEDGKGGVLVKAALDSVLREQKLWDDAKQAEYDRLNADLREAEKKLAKGRIKLSEAREVAIQMRRDRAGLRRLLSDRNALDLTTAESQAENAQFNFLVSECTMRADTGKRAWKSVEEYEEAGDSELAVAAARAFGTIFYGLDEQWETKLPENKFLVQYGFARADGRLVNKDGHLVDSQGRLIDEDGYFVDASGQRVDADGVPVDEQGDYKLDFSEFLDEDGKPVPVPEESKEKDKEEADKEPAEATK